MVTEIKAGSPPLKQQLAVLRWVNIWVLCTLLSGFASVTSSTIASLSVAIIVFVVCVLFWKIISFESGRSAQSIKENYRLTTFVLCVAIAVVIVIVLLHLLLAPAAAWDLLDFWAPLGIELSEKAPKNIIENSHQPFLLPSTFSLWGSATEAFGYIEPHLGSVLFWMLLFLVVCVLTYLVFRLAGGSKNKALAGVILFLTIPLYENHAALFGYTEILVLALILAIFSNLIAYQATRNPAWLAMVILCAVGLTFTRNTGIVYAAIALISLLLLSFPKSVISVATVITILPAVLWVFVLEDEPNNLTFRDGVFEGEISSCPADSAKFLYLRLYGAGDQYDTLRDSAFFDARVISWVENEKRKFVLSSEVASPESVWAVRVQCKGRRGDRFKATETHYVPVAERKLMLSEHLQLYVTADRYVMRLAGRTLRINASIDNLPQSSFAALYLNSSFGIAPTLMLFALVLGVKRNKGTSNDSVLSWWGNYLVVYTAIALLAWVALYYFLPYLRINSWLGLDTVGSRTLFPIVVSLCVGCAAFLASMAEPQQECRKL